MFGQRRKATIWILVAAWAALIFGLSSIPGAAFPNVPVSNFDKVVHFVIYGVLGALSAAALRSSSRLAGRRALFAAALLATAYGVSDELHQRWVPGRSSDVHDVMADALGGAAGAALVLMR